MRQRQISDPEALKRARADATHFTREAARYRQAAAEQPRRYAHFMEQANYSDEAARRAHDRARDLVA